MNAPNNTDDTAAIVAANLRMVRALSPEEWRAVNIAANDLFKSVRKGRTIPLAEGCDSFEDAGRYRLAHLAAGILLDMAEHAALTDDTTYVETFVEAVRDDGRLPKELVESVLPVLVDVFGPAAVAFAELTKQAAAAAEAAAELAEATGRE